MLAADEGGDPMPTEPEPSKLEPPEAGAGYDEPEEVSPMRAAAPVMREHVGTTASYGRDRDSIPLVLFLEGGVVTVVAVGLWCMSIV